VSVIERPLLKKTSHRTLSFGLSYDRLVATEVREESVVEAAFARGDEPALRTIYDAHARLVYSYCRRSLTDERAKEVTQDVFVSAWKGREKFDSSRGSLPAWLIGITKNRLIDNVRAEQRHSSRRAGTEPVDVGVEAEVEKVGDKMLVADALKTLPDRARKVIELAYFEGLSHQQVSERTDLPLGTVKSDIRRGLASIRRHVEVIDE
jgi:RNA polymerase sigma factor (sigma-70 family)